MIEYNCRQAFTIILAHAEAVSWSTQLFVSACERADTILYSDQHAVALLVASLSWLQHIFFAAFAKVLQYIANTSDTFS